MFYIKRTLVKNGLVRRQPTNSNKNIGGAFTISRFNNESKVCNRILLTLMFNKQILLFFYLDEVAAYNRTHCECLEADARL